MRVDGVAGALLDLLDHRPQAEIVHLRRPAAALAHHVVVVARLAQDVGMVAVGQVEALDDAQGHEDLERAEDRGAAHGQPAAPAFTHQLRRREVAVVLGDHGGHEASRLRALVARAVQHGEERFHCGHGCTIPLPPRLHPPLVGWAR